MCSFFTVATQFYKGDPTLKHIFEDFSYSAVTFAEVVRIYIKKNNLVLQHNFKTILAPLIMLLTQYLKIHLQV